MNKIFLLLLSFLFSVNVLSNVDKWNTYQWNKKNHELKNNKIDTRPWYEWWYFKVVEPKSGKSYFFVYGIVNPWDTDHTLSATRSYVGVGDFLGNTQVENKFTLSDFKASYDETLITIKNNIATNKKIKGFVIDEDGTFYDWDIRVDKKWAYNAEGWMMGTGLTDIEWYPAQASASCSGYIFNKNERVEFKEAPCYQDRNWGIAFPEWWTWIVSNHFNEDKDAALAIGGGKPTLKGGRTSPMASVSIGFLYKGEEYTFRPIDLDIMKTDVSYRHWKVKAQNSRYKIEIVADAPEEKFMDLEFMTPTGDVFHDYETLTGDVTLKFYKRRGLSYKLETTLTSPFAGIEFGSPKDYRQKLILKKMDKDGFIDLLSD